MDAGYSLTSLARSYGIIFVALVTFVVFSVVSRKAFLSPENIYGLFYGVSLDLYAITGFTLLIIMGEIDLSVGSVYALSGTTAGYLATRGFPTEFGILIGILIGFAVGAGNGLLVVKLKINSIILTIGTLLTVRGLSDVVAATMAGNRYAEGFRAIARARFLSLNWTVPAMFLVVLVLEFVLSRSTSARVLYYIGNNRKSALIHGMRTDATRIGAFVLSGGLAALSGVLVASRITIADVDMGRHLEFTILTAAVIGGASLFGGRGRVVNSVVAYLFLAMLVNGLIMFGVEPVFHQVIVGVILVAVVAADTQLNKEAG